MKRRGGIIEWMPNVVGPRRWRAPSRSSERGAALLLVIWIFIVLFVVVLDFATSMRDDGLATANFADETQAYYIALGGLNRTIYDVLLALEDNPDIFDDTDDFGDDDDYEGDGEDEDNDVSDTIAGDSTWRSENFGGGSYSVRLLDEGGKINLNAVTEALLTRVVRRALIGGNATEGTSVSEERAVATVVHSILDWRDPDDMEHLEGAEAGYYASLARPYAIKNGRFDSVDELLLVKGVTPDLYYGTEETVGLSQIFSVFSRSGRINVMRAPAAVLRVLFDLDADEADELIEERETESFAFVAMMRERMEAIDPDLARLLHGGMSGMITVEAHGSFGERSTARVAAIVDLTDSFEGARVFRWLDRVPAGWEPGRGDDESEDEAVDDEA